jgi:hypothetical protein
MVPGPLEMTALGRSRVRKTFHSGIKKGPVFARPSRVLTFPVPGRCIIPPVMHLTVQDITINPEYRAHYLLDNDSPLRPQSEENTWYRRIPLQGVVATAIGPN